MVDMVVGILWTRDESKAYTSVSARKRSGVNGAAKNHMEETCMGQKKKMKKSSLKRRKSKVEGSGVGPESKGN